MLLTISQATDILATIAILLSAAIIPVMLLYAKRHWQKAGYMRVYKAITALIMIGVLSLELYEPILLGEKGEDTLFHVILFSGIILVQAGILMIGISDL